MDEQPTIFVGIDVSKDRLDVHFRPSDEAFHVPRDARGLEVPARRFSSLPVALVLLEATGGFEASMAAALAAAGLPLCIVNPRQIRDFARAMGRLAKTDALDAEVIALFAERIRPPIRPLPKPERSHLADLVSRRRQIIGKINMETNRRDQAADKQPIRRISRHIAFLEKGLAELDGDIGQTIKATPVWCETEALLKFVIGVGDVTARTLLAQLPELGTIGRDQLAAFVGVAPINRNSGLMRGRRSIAGGRTSVRGVLYMAALTAIRRGSPFRPFYERHTGDGRPREVALAAVMRKLLVTLNAIVHDRTPWRPLTARPSTQPHCRAGAAVENLALSRIPRSMIVNHTIIPRDRTLDTLFKLYVCLSSRRTKRGCVISEEIMIASLTTNAYLITLNYNKCMYYFTERRDNETCYIFSPYPQ